MTAQSLDAPAHGRSMVRPSVPIWAFAVAAVGALALSGLLWAADFIRGIAAFVLLAVVLYVAAQTAAAWVVEGGRRAKDRFMTSMLVVAVFLAVLPLVLVLGYTIVMGVQRVNAGFFTHSMRAVAEQDPNGGIYHAIIGTLEQVGLATVIAVPFAVLVAIYLVEYSGNGRLGRAVSFFVDVMTGLPSIVAGLFILTLWILTLHQSFSGFAGSLALVILMLPTVVRSAEEMFRLVPASLREASLALGVPKWITILRIVVPTALPGVITGIMLAVARVMGETAPVLLTVFGNTSINFSPFNGPQASLPLFVFQEAGLPNDTAIARAWAAALTLIVLVLVLNLLARAIARLSRVR
jgi:phosphate transport system permease protein